MSTVALDTVRWILVGAVAGGALTAKGQTPESEQSRGQQLEEIVVTAQKREQNLQDVPISVGVMSAETLESRNIVGLPQLVQATPSLSFNDGFSPIATSLSIRGVGSYAYEGGIQPSVSVVVDGVSLARAGEFVQELADVERVEVLRGPQGTLFGRNSTGGALNIVRRRPTQAFEGSLEGSFTDDEDYLVRGVLSGPLSDKVRGRLAAFYRDFEGFIDNLFPGGRSGETLGGTESYGFVGKLDVDFSEQVNLLVSADYRKAIHGLMPNATVVSEGFDLNGDGIDDRVFALGNGDAALGQAVLNDIYKVNVSKRSDQFENESYGIGAELSWEIATGLALKSISAYREFTDDNNGDTDSTPADGNNLIMPIVSVTTSIGPNGTKNTRGVDSDYWSQELRLEKTGHALDWIVGGFYQKFNEQTRNEVPLLIIDFFNPAFGPGGSAVGGTPAFGDEFVLTNTPLENSNELKTWAVFADGTWHLTDRVDLFAGVRYTHEDLAIRLNNRRQFAILSRQAIAARFNPATGVLDVSGIPVFPAAADAVGSASNSDGDLSGRFGLSWKATDTVNMYVTVTRGFVGAGANVGRTGLLGNVFLDPSVADSYEIGMKSTLFERLRVNAAVFSMKVEDLQTSRLVPGTTETEAVNAGNLKTRGVEADLTFVANDMFSIAAGLTWLDTEFEDLVQPCYFGQVALGAAGGCTIDTNNDGIPNAQRIDGKPAVATPEFKYNVALDLAVPVAATGWNFYGSLGYVWQDDVNFDLKFDPLTVQKSYGLLDLTLGMRDHDGRYDVAVFGKNLTDEEYVLNASEAFGAIGRLFVRPARDGQRYFGIKLQYHF